MAYQPNESGYYPPGAEHDPMAPWNQDEDDTEIEHSIFCKVNNISGNRRCDCQDDKEEFEHNEYCAVNRVRSGPCDCEGDY